MQIKLEKQKKMLKANSQNGLSQIKNHILIKEINFIRLIAQN